MAVDLLLQLLQDRARSLLGVVAVADERQRLDGLAVHEDLHLHQSILAVRGDLVVHRAVAARHRLQLVVEVVDDLGERDLVLQDLPRLADHLLRLEDAAAGLGELHQVADVLVRADDLDLDDRLEDALDARSVGEVGGIVDLDLRAVVEVDLVRHRRRRLHDRHAALALEALLHDVHVQEAEEPAAEAEAERLAVLRLEGEARIVQVQLLDRLAQLLEVGLLAVFVGARRIEVAEDHLLRLFVALERDVGRVEVERDGVADAHIAEGLHARAHRADLRVAQLLDLLREGRVAQQFRHREGAARAHHADLVALLEVAVEDAHIHHDAAVLVVLRVEDEAAQLLRGRRLRHRKLLADRVEERLDSLAGLRRDIDALLGGEAKDLLDLHRDGIGVRGGEIDLVDDGDDREVARDREVRVRDGLRLDALRRVDDEHRAFARLERARHLVGEVDMAGRVDEVELVLLALVGVLDRHGRGLDGDAALALEVHRVEELGAGLALGDGLGRLQQAVCEGRLAVVNVGDDGEVADLHGNRTV